MSNIIIRKGVETDVPAAFELIRELAIYENAEDEVKTTVESMLADGFGEQPLYEFLVAEEDREVIGIALYYFRYSTWKGKCLYLEDFVVKQPHRHKGIGQLLFDQLMEVARETKSRRISWEVLDWNEPAIKFYKKNQAAFDHEWIKCAIVEEQIYPNK